MSEQKLIHVGYTNGHQIRYAKEEQGAFYPDTENDCYIPLFMYERHLNRTAPDLEKYDYVMQLESDLDDALIERDYWAEKATELARAIGEHLNVDVGEHSSANCPVLNALTALEIT